jgi:hypothetical protein
VEEKIVLHTIESLVEWIRHTGVKDRHPVNLFQRVAEVQEALLLIEKEKADKAQQQLKQRMSHRMVAFSYIKYEIIQKFYSREYTKSSRPIKPIWTGKARLITRWRSRW